MLEIFNTRLDSPIVIYYSVLGHFILNVRGVEGFKRSSCCNFGLLGT